MKEMHAYKILHIPTGLYYKPGIPNLSEVGKTYSRRPSVKSIQLRWVRVTENQMPIFEGKPIVIKKYHGIMFFVAEENDFKIVTLKDGQWTPTTEEKTSEHQKQKSEIQISFSDFKNICRYNKNGRCASGLNFGEQCVQKKCPKIKLK